MNEENEPLGKVYHEQIKLPLFPVYYDVFFCDDMWMAPMAVSSRYPGITVDMDPATDSITTVVTAPGKTTGILVMFVLKEDHNDVRNHITYESVNLSWIILNQLEITINEDNYKIQSFVVEEINKKINEAYDRFVDSEESDEHNKSNDSFDDL